MNDQASALRLAPARTQDAAPLEGPPVLVVGSGKGGVGKSTLAVLVAAASARSGRRTLLVDGAQNQGNLHVLLGVRPAAHLADVFAGEATPDRLVVPLQPGLDLVPSDSGDERLYALGPFDRARLHHRVSTLFDGWDAVVVDGGAGVEDVLRACGIRASRLLAIAAPEPAALSDAYALLKLASLQLPFLSIDVMVNRVHADDEAWRVHDRLALAVHRFLGRELPLAGWLLENERLRHLALRPGALLEARFDGLDDVAARLLEAAPARDAAGTPLLTRDLAS